MTISRPTRGPGAIGVVAGLLVLGALAGCGRESAPARALPPPGAVVAGPQGRVGQFVVECGFDRVAPDDPIVHPGHPGASHLHAFFGAIGVDAHTTYDDLLAGDTTCDQRLDTAAYWAPVLVDADGRTVEPLGSVAYYRAGPGVDPVSVVAFPPGLQMVAGDALAVEPQPTSVVAWSCATGAERAERPPDCRGAASLRLVVTFPDCWDGERLASDDHVSHTAYSAGGSCPASHPLPVPQLQFAVDYPPLDPAGLMLGSGSILSGHADFWNGWHQDKLEREVAQCIGRDLVCGVTG